MPESLSPILITAGPTYEPIDSVRFIGNRSSGRIGVALAEAAVQGGLETVLLLGPNCVTPDIDPSDTARFELARFRSTNDLESLLQTYWPDRAHSLIMAAAVSDFRPGLPHAAASVSTKMPRERGGFSLSLEPTPDLVAACAARRRERDLIVAFALEKAEELRDRAWTKLQRKDVDAIVANPLETMDAGDIDATLLWANGATESPGRCSKEDFARWLIQTLRDHQANRNA